LGVQRLAIVDEVRERAAALAEKLSGQFGDRRVAAADAGEVVHVDGLIHATPMGMARHPGIALAPELLRPELWVNDLVYFPLETELLRRARERGCRILNGGGMAVFQAARAFHLFTGVEPDAERMLAGFIRRKS
jgi:shikimate dehydrogenase